MSSQRRGSLQWLPRQPRLGASPVLDGASLAPDRIVPKLIGSVLSLGGLPPLLRGHSCIQKLIMLRHSVTLARIRPVRERANVLLRRPSEVAPFQGHRSADPAATHAHHEIMRGVRIMKGPWHPPVTTAPTPESI